MIAFRGLRVTLHMRSGRRFSFRCATIEKTFTGNKLNGLTGEDTKGWPFYFDLDQVEAVTTRTVLWPRWR